MRNSYYAPMLAGVFLTFTQTGLAQRAIRTHLSPTFEGLMGSAVTAIGDVDADGVVDYAVGGMRIDIGGNGAGAVQAFSGATGALLWTASGAGGWIPCAGGASTGDRFGAALALIPDADGDGLDDVAVGSPLAGVLTQGCLTPWAGQSTVISSVTGAQISATVGTAPGDFYGVSIRRASDITSDGVDDYIVLASDYFDVIDGATNALFLRIPLPNGATEVVSIGDLDGDGFAREVLIGQGAGPDSFVLQDVVTGVSSAITGAPGGDLGRAVAYVPPSASTVGGFLVGAPGEAGGRGEVYFFDRNGSIGVIATGAPGDGLGSLLVYGGNADFDSTDDDFLAEASAGGFVAIRSLEGDTLGTVAVAAPLQREALAWIGASPVTGLNDFLVGEPFGDPVGGFATAYFGGPDGSLDPDYGAGCNPGGGAIPALSQDIALSPGLPFTAFVRSAPAFAPLALYWGISSPNGIPLLGCKSWLQPVPTPQLQATGTTSAIGAWASIGLAFPLDPTLVGLEVAMQAVVILPGGGVAFTNATSNTIGW